MHSLKPTGDNIAQEFYNILKKAQSVGEGVIEEASSDESSSEDSKYGPGSLTDLVQKLQDGSAEEAQMDMAQHASDINIVDAEGGANDSFQVSDADDALLDMITDQEDAVDDMSAYNMIDEAVESLEATSSEKRVLDGLAKIAGSLRSRGEAFAADVVLTTAVSIRKDLVKEASKRKDIVSGLKKIASDLYSTGDQLAGDMVQVTINKIADNDPFGDDDDFMKRPDRLGRGTGTQRRLREREGRGTREAEKAGDTSLYADPPAQKVSAIAHIKKVEALEAAGKIKPGDYLPYGLTGDMSNKGGYYDVEFKDGKSIRVTKSEL